MGAGIETFGVGFAIAATVASAAYAGATGGAEGLGDFAAGGVGAMMGSAVGNVLVGKSTVRAPNDANNSSTVSQPRSESELEIDNNITDANWQGAKDIRTYSINSSAENDLYVATRISQKAQIGQIGRGKLLQLISPGPQPGPGELFWRGTADDNILYGGWSQKVGGFIKKAVDNITVFIPSKYKNAIKVINAIGKGGEIDIKVGKIMEFTGKWIKSQFPEPYW